MLFETTLIIVGIAIVLVGADLLTDGASRVARKMGMPEFVVGLTVVAFGTSMPELCVSMASALDSVPDMAVGNVVGSNIFNSLLIVGVCAVIHPMAVTTANIRRDLPFAFIATLMLIFFLVDGTLGKGEGLVMLLAFAIYTTYTILKTRDAAPAAQPQQVRRSLPKLFYNPLLRIAVGLGLLVWGSDVFVGHATTLAEKLGVSEAVIGITILGAGTSLPELATSVVAAMKGSTSMALGNVVGSCVFNILLILGLTAVVVPLSPMGITTVDLATLFTASLLLWLFSFTKATMERWEGVTLTLAFAAYMTWLLLTA